MVRKTLIAHILGLGRPVFSARELSAVSGKSPSTVSQGLAFLAGEGLVVKVAHGVWSAGAGGFLLAEPEKALVDCLYVSAFRKRQFSHFPELSFPGSFSFKTAYDWVGRIKSPKAAVHARRRLDIIKRGVDEGERG